MDLLEVDLVAQSRFLAQPKGLAKNHDTLPDHPQLDDPACPRIVFVLNMWLRSRQRAASTPTPHERHHSLTLSEGKRSSSRMPLLRQPRNRPWHVYHNGGSGLQPHHAGSSPLRLKPQSGFGNQHKADKSAQSQQVGECKDVLSFFVVYWFPQHPTGGGDLWRT